MPLRDVARSVRLTTFEVETESMTDARVKRWTHVVGVVIVAPFYVGLYLITLIGGLFDRNRR